VRQGGVAGRQQRHDVERGGLGLARETTRQQKGRDSDRGSAGRPDGAPRQPQAARARLRRGRGRRTGVMPDGLGEVLQLDEHVVRRGPPSVGLLRQADRGEALHRRRRFRHHVVRSIEGPSARDHFVDDGAEGEQVGASIGGLALELFRRHVVERPEDRALLGEARVCDAPDRPIGAQAQRGESKVEYTWRVRQRPFREATHATAPSASLELPALDRPVGQAGRREDQRGHAVSGDPLLHQAADFQDMRLGSCRARADGGAPRRDRGADDVGRPPAVRDRARRREAHAFLRDSPRLQTPWLAGVVVWGVALALLALSSAQAPPRLVEDADPATCVPADRPREAGWPPAALHADLGAGVDAHVGARAFEPCARLGAALDHQARSRA